MTDLQAGPELDGRVAVEAMGWRLKPDTVDILYPPKMPFDVPCTMVASPPAYSTDISAAMEVVAKLPGHFDLWREHGGLWSARFWRGSYVIGEVRGVESAPLAICRAALASQQPFVMADHV